MKTKSSAKTVVVTGDFTLDWNLALSQKPEGTSPTMGYASGSRQQWQRGGAGMLADLVTAVAAGISSSAAWDVRQPDFPQRGNESANGCIGPENPEFHHSYAIWLPYDFAPLDETKKNEKKAWRVSEFLGVTRRLSKEPSSAWGKVKDDVAGASLVVLDDADLGFRNNRDLWPASLRDGGDAHPWIIVKTSRPVAQGPLWEHLCEHHPDRVIALMTVNDLRLTDVQISRELSWERTAQDLAWEMLYNDGLEGLRKCAHVVASFNTAGAFLYSRTTAGDPSCKLLFDPKVIEGMWERGYPGQMVGYSSCLVMGIARELMLEPEKPKIDRGILAGLHAMRTLHSEGYGERGAKPADIKLAFPVAAVANALAADDKTLDTEFASAQVPSRVAGKRWTILDDCCPRGLETAAAEVVRRGLERALHGVPFGFFGDLVTVDRQEIESLRSIRSLASEYLAQPKPKRPLCVAAFGPPGAGKSFGITQLAMALRPGEIEVREFNMSQLRSTDELLTAFHQVRDIGLSGKIPLIFWDEFDSAFEDNFGWLRYFLAPMQDGKFLHGNLPHPIGRAIFVFAGGTSATLQAFGRNLDPEKARAAKVPDFVSRLRGYIDVLGPNPVIGQDDPYYVLRRAILLRSMLKRDAKHLERNGELQIDSGVLRAMLLTTAYRHGARSMESIIAMSHLGGQTRFERSALPSRAQLDLHVEGRNFLALVHQPEGKRLERMAEEVHQIYCEEQKAAGWKYGPVRDDEAKINPVLIDFDKLSDELKEQNREQVRDIFSKLEHVHCSMAPAKEREPVYVFPKQLEEELASMEHTRWMRLKARKGWRYAAKRNDAEKLHDCMLPWHKGDLSPYAGFEDILGPAELSEAQKEKDRAAVRNIPRVLRCGGYTIVPPPQKPPSPSDKKPLELDAEFPATVIVHPQAA